MRATSLRIARAVRLIGERYHHPRQVTLEALGREVGLSKPYLCRAFRRTVGVGLPRYVADLRAAHARRLLAEPALSIKEIAAAVGFDHVSQLDRAFRRRYGLAPSGFRARLASAEMPDAPPGT